MASIRHQPRWRGSPSDRSSLRHLLEASLRRPLVVLAPLAVALLGGLAVSAAVPDRYRAAALVEAEWGGAAIASVPVVQPELADRRLRAVRRRTLDATMIERALRVADQRGSRPGEVAKAEERLEARSIAVSVMPTGPGTFLIECVHASPQTAARVANRLAWVLVEEAEDARLSGQVLEAQLSEARKAVEERGAALLRLRAKSPRAPEAGPTTAEYQASRPAGPRSMRRQIQQLERLTRDYDDARSQYEAVLRRAAEAKSRVDAGWPARFRVRRSASAPQEAFHPNRLVLALVGLALGLAFGLGASLLSESRDRGVRGPEDLRETLPQPLLAELPLVRTRRRDRRT